MKKTSQIALGASVLFFLAAGTIKFWPEERFSPRPSLTTAGLTGGAPLQVIGPSAQILPRNQGFLPAWLRRDPMTQRDTNGPGNNAAPISPGTLPGGKMATSPPMTSANGAEKNASAKKMPDTKIVSLAAQNMPVGDVLAQVFHRAGVPFSLPGRLREPVNIIFVDAPLSQALDQTLSLTTKPHLTCHKENGVYVVVSDDSYDSTTTAELPPPPAMGLRRGAF